MKQTLIGVAALTASLAVHASAQRSPPPPPRPYDYFPQVALVPSHAVPRFLVGEESTEYRTRGLDIDGEDVVINVRPAWSCRVHAESEVEFIDPFTRGPLIHQGAVVVMVCTAGRAAVSRRVACSAAPSRATAESLTLSRAGAPAHEQADIFVWCSAARR